MRKTNKTPAMRMTAAALAGLARLLAGCTQEQQNQIRCDIQNWTGTEGMLDENLNGQVDPGLQCLGVGAQ